MRLVLAGLVLLFPLVQARPAEACDCDLSRSARMVPEDGATDVPLDVQLVFRQAQGPSPSSGPAPVLRSPTGAVAGVTITANPNETQVMTPAAPLAPFTRYEIVHDGVVQGTFVTGERAQAEIPAAPRIDRFEMTRAPLLGELLCEYESIDRLDLQVSGGTQVLALSYRIADWNPYNYLVFADELGLEDQGACGKIDFLAPENGGRACLTVSSRAASGQLSEPTRVCDNATECAPTTEDHPVCAASGCRVAAGGAAETWPGGLAALLAAVVVGLRRRERS